MRLWYVQLSVSDYEYFKKAITTNGSIIFYDKGKAKMKTIPSKGDLVEVLSKKHIVYVGKVISDEVSKGKYSAFGLSLCPVRKPIFVNKFFRRNWTENKTDLQFILS